MARKLNMFFLVALVAATLQCSVAQRTHVVGDSLGWTIPRGGAVDYTTWASTQSFVQGDILVFNFPTGAHDVAEVNRASFDSCNSANPISLINTGPANITLNAAGEHFYICAFPSHCGLGQKLAINVSAAPSTSPPPQTATPPPSPVATPEPTPSPVPATSPAPSPSSRAAQTYVVGDSLGWIVPPGGPIAYQTWARNKTFLVGDILVFNFTSPHNVAQVTSKSAYDSCNTSATNSPITTSPARITLTTSGEHFYICTVPNHCTLGQKLAINVSGTAATPASGPAPATARPPSSPAPGPSSPGATPPSSSTTPPPSSSATPPPSSSTTPPPSSSTTPPPPSSTGGSAPPPPNSAPSFAGAALPITVVAAALAFFY